MLRLPNSLLCKIVYIELSPDKLVVGSGKAVSLALGGRGDIRHLMEAPTIIN